ncbi:MAG: GTPase Era [Bacteroidetes bacterium GWC2_33_15]|nr:MAG: GTPase Era [Bacteroidetes bacterium GWA2_33_15]OFX50192.1 MAG: GTPase Era [Bacteroidetes bacterium GWC2_33_15]OFX65344.1 MAG: GTPase Era [Bacteroidetes bacterium GWB2_32_14]OFX70571.1 MAG: GTPase Era [Bacteroidetes bacterium GWD2_33_33]HAN19555.1 GTPase Era [Bacteroidales bacterium]
MSHKSGFVNILGNPNVGKSTLMNALVGEKLSIITSKAQTTRHRIMGIVNGDDFQIVYSDTPGILKPNYKLQEKMMGYVGSAFEDADIILYLTDVIEKSDKNQLYIDRLSQADAPVLLLINKIDLSNQEDLEKIVDRWKKILPKAEIIPISALKNFNLEYVLKRIIEKLPESPPYFPKDSFTDKTERFFASEIIREKILLNYQKEIPYSVEVEIEEFKDTEKLLRMRAIIYVIRSSQKGIIIGHKGEALKKTGTEARKDLEDFFGKKVFLEMFVKVSKDWRDKDRTLNNFGYTI